MLDRRLLSLPSVDGFNAVAGKRQMNETGGKREARVFIAPLRAMIIGLLFAPLVVASRCHFHHRALGDVATYCSSGRQGQGGDAVARTSLLRPESGWTTPSERASEAGQGPPGPIGTLS